MEATALSETRPDGGTGSATVADLLPLATARYGDAAAVRWKESFGWTAFFQVSPRRP